MGFEGGGSSERMFRRSPEDREKAELQEQVLRNPEQVFDSSSEGAKQESEIVFRDIESQGRKYETRRDVETIIERDKTESGSTGKNSIKIVWNRNGNKKAIMLQLDPITEGKGNETGVLAYRGRYGLGEVQPDHSIKMSETKGDSLSLEELFMAPEGIEFVIKPTISRWAVGVDEASYLFGENCRTLYMGLGFLFLGEEWMTVGMHEAGHLPKQPDENAAWTTAKRNYASLYQRVRSDLLKGKSISDDQIREINEKRSNIRSNIAHGKFFGRFGILKRPLFRNDLTIGRIEQFGIVSHSLKDHAKIPTQWQGLERRIMERFQEHISDAYEAYEKMTR